MTLDVKMVIVDVVVITVVFIVVVIITIFHLFLLVLILDQTLATLFWVISQGQWYS